MEAQKTKEKSSARDKKSWMEIRLYSLMWTAPKINSTQNQILIYYFLLQLQVRIQENDECFIKHFVFLKMLQLMLY